jgi:hypothetical protein
VDEARASRLPHTGGVRAADVSRRCDMCIWKRHSVVLIGVSSPGFRLDTAVISESDHESLVEKQRD